MGGQSRLATAPWQQVVNRSATPSDESGFSLVEVIVAIGLIGVVMASLSTFYVGSLATTSAQSGRQAAIQLALDGMELARAVDPADLGTLTPDQPIVNSITFDRRWDITPCLQSSTPDSACAATSLGAAVPAGWVVLSRVVVEVTWSEKGCGSSACSYETSTLISPATDDPIFNANSTPPPTVTDPPDQSHVQGSTVTLAMSHSGGSAPLFWLLSGQPNGLSINSTTGVISGTVTTLGTSPKVTVTVRDSLSRDSTVEFSWTVTAPAAPTLASAGPWTDTAGTAITTGRSVAVTAGAYPLSWSASNLPSGLAINSGTGNITGTPTQPGTYTNVIVRVTDTIGRSDSRTVNWTINPAPTPPTLAQPSNQTWVYNSTISVNAPTVSGGTAPFTWGASGLPSGVTIDATGRLSGRITQSPSWTSRTATITVTDKLGKQDSVTFTWRVTLAGSDGNGNGGPGK